MLEVRRDAEFRNSGNNRISLKIDLDLSFKKLQETVLGLYMVGEKKYIKVLKI